MKIPSRTDEMARECLDDPARLATVAEGLQSGSVPTIGDCAETMTKVAEHRPDLVAPHARILVALLSHKNGRVRWESAHALALITPLVESVIEANLPLFVELIRRHDGVIVRDYALDVVGRYGSLGPTQAVVAWEILREALGLWEGRHAARILRHLGPLAEAEPTLRPSIVESGERHTSDPRAAVQKSARALLKTLR